MSEPKPKTSAGRADGLSLRPVEEADLEVVRELRLQALALCPQAFCATLAREQAMSDAQWRARLRSNAQRLETAGWLALLNGQAVGMLVGVYVDGQPPSAELAGMWVEPGARGRGAARALVEAALGWGRQRACGQAVLEVNPAEEPAYRLYLACGFAPVGPRRPMPGHPQREVQPMRLTL